MTTERDIAIARSLRQRSTDAEARLWSHLRSRQMEGAKFRRQMPIAGYIADFACPAARLVIELDGGQHADDPRDAERTAAIECAGYIVLRFWNHDALGNTEGVLEDIRAAIANARAD
jgi:very-short-patch-repair endonuclease